MFFARIGCGGIKGVDELFGLVDPVRLDSSIAGSMEELPYDDRDRDHDHDD